MSNQHILKKGSATMLFVAGMVCLIAFSTAVVRAQEAPLPVDVCTNVPGDQEAEPCADVQCALDGGTWSGSSCDMPPPLPPEPPAQEPTTVATSTDGTGGLTGGTILTGDALASTTVENELNTNITNAVDQPGESNSSVLTASTTNEAELSTEDITDASTGENTAEGGESLATIVTGTAAAFANVINIVNTNIFNSEGLILFLNQLFGVGLDLRTFNLSYFFNGEAGASPTVAENTGEPQCTLLTCMNSSALNVFNTNTATVTNSVLVRASTGQNIASTTEGGEATIDTGDAYAAANVLNLVNTNIINSSYLLVAFNNFGNLAGDITLPDADFFTRLFAQGGSAPEMNSSTYGVNNTNSANFTGTTTASAETGANIASTTGTGMGEVLSGNAYTQANTFNEVNTTQIGGTSVFLFFRTFGNWTGTVKGLPAGMSWATTTGGVIVMSDNSATGLPEAPEANCDEDIGPVSNCFNASHLLASSTNTANVEDNVEVSAVTGENTALTENATSSVSTGNAYAVANVVNMVNTSIVGRNWIFAIFNIFGDWTGDISFGQSELQLEALAQTPAQTRPGSDVTYLFTVHNSGDADADNVVLKADFDKNLLSFGQGGSAGVLDTDTGKQWDLGKVARGETRTFSYTAQVGDIPAGTSMTIPLTATISRGANGAGGGDVLFTLVTIDVTSPAPAPSNGGGGGGGGGGGIIGANGVFNATPDPKITAKKTLSISTTTAPTIVDYKVVVENNTNAGALYHGLLTDTLYDPSGSVMYTRSWDLSTVPPADQITLTYSVAFGTSTKPGIYRNVARVTGMSNHPTVGNPFVPVEASSNLEFTATGKVLGASTVASTSICEPLLTSFISRGRVNKPSEVLKLQTFLNTQGSTLPTTGFFGPKTVSAVKVFQQKYATEVLVPLGIKVPTGSVYSATQRKINQLACGGASVAAAPVSQVVSAATIPSAQASAPKPKLKTPKVTPPAATPSVPAAPVIENTPAPKQTGWFSSLKSLLGGF
ncbi:MAG: Uncharacterized protein G01um101456_516 [Parcubacteria group bacterium Gr01-1014_56]|nr:MAG: Uncharacterized protein G01um101456_516 [Parcubacteria group bacterium Gr01-1014_56]